MKLMLCTFCRDIVALGTKKRYCKCRRSAARYEVDCVHAVFAGKYAVPLGIDSSTLNKALQQRKERGDGVKFEAWVVSEQVPTVRYTDSTRKL